MRLCWLGLAILTVSCSERRDVDAGPAPPADASPGLSCGAAAAITRCGALGDRPDAGAETDGATTVVRVTDRIVVPTSSQLARDLGCDLDDNGTPDNQLGNILSALRGIVDSQSAEDDAERAGELLLLLADQAGSPAATLGVPQETGSPSGSWHGRTFTPACGRAPLSASDPGRFVGDRLSVPLALVPGQHAVAVDLTHVRITVDAQGGGTLCGAVELCALTQRYLPALVRHIGERIAAGGTEARDLCTLFDLHARCAQNPDACMAFDPTRTPPPDCIHVEDLLENPVVRAVLKPDVTLDGQALVSVGLGVTWVEAASR